MQPIEIPSTDEVSASLFKSELCTFTVDLDGRLCGIQVRITEAKTDMDRPREIRMFGKVMTICGDPWTDSRHDDIDVDYFVGSPRISRIEIRDRHEDPLP